MKWISAVYEHSLCMTLTWSDLGHCAYYLGVVCCKVCMSCSIVEIAVAMRCLRSGPLSHQHCTSTGSSPSLLLSEKADSYQKARQHFKIYFIFPLCSMSNPGSSTWAVPSTATSGTVTYSKATAAGTGRGGGCGDGGGTTVSNLNMKAITEQPHKEDKPRG